MRRPGGHAEWRDGAGRVTREADTFTCAHCGRVVVVAHGEREPGKVGGWCAMCAKPKCPRCAATPGCTPFDRQLERSEARARLLRAVTGS